MRRLRIYASATYASATQHLPLFEVVLWPVEQTTQPIGHALDGLVCVAFAHTPPAERPDQGGVQLASVESLKVSLH